MIGLLNYARLYKILHIVNNQAVSSFRCFCRTLTFRVLTL